MEVPPAAGGKRQALVRIALEASARSVDQIETAEAYSPSPALGSPLPPLRIRYEAPQVCIALLLHVCVLRSWDCRLNVPAPATAGTGRLPGLAIHAAATLQQLCMR